MSSTSLTWFGFCRSGNALAPSLDPVGSFSVLVFSDADFYRSRIEKLFLHSQLHKRPGFQAAILLEEKLGFGAVRICTASINTAVWGPLSWWWPKPLKMLNSSLGLKYDNYSWTLTQHNRRQFHLRFIFCFAELRRERIKTCVESGNLGFLGECRLHY